LHFKKTTLAFEADHELQVELTLFQISRVCIKGYIWPKNPHNLFDFESNLFQKKEIELDFSGINSSIPFCLARLATIDKELVALSKNVFI
jgi:hypothetical protein